MIFSSLENHSIDLTASSESYKDTVHEKKQSESTDILVNNTSQNASLVLAELLNLALEKNVPLRLISGSLHPGCYDDLAPIAEEILRTVKPATGELPIRVILTEFDDLEQESNSFFKALERHPNAEVKVPRASDPASVKDAPHFAVIGDTAFRYENDHETAEADFSFNNRNIARTLVDYFDKWFDALSRVQNIQPSRQYSTTA